jgi:hypothetical protein
MLTQKHVCIKDYHACCSMSFRDAYSRTSNEGDKDESRAWNAEIIFTVVKIKLVLIQGVWVDSCERRERREEWERGGRCRGGLSDMCDVAFGWSCDLWTWQNLAKMPLRRFLLP